jgi:hypothetical protein
VPDVPLERFELALDGGKSGALITGAGVDLCTDRRPRIRAEFTAHSGATASHRERVAIAGCGPRAKLTLKRLRSRRPALKLTVRPRKGAPELRKVRLRLPRALHVRSSRVARGLRARGDGRRIKATLTRKGVLKARAPGGAKRIVVRLRKGAFRASRTLRKRRSLSIRLRTTDVAKTVRKQTLVVRVRR